MSVEKHEHEYLRGQEDRTLSLNRSSSLVRIPFPPITLPVPGPPFYFDLVSLAEKDETLRPFLHGSPSCFTFRRPEATAAATKSILLHYFNIKLRLSPHFLIPPIPSRLQYLNWALTRLQDAATTINGQHDTRTKDQKHYWIYDIGTGASCIFPLLGCRILPPPVNFLATELSYESLVSARRNIADNQLSDRIKTYQPESSISDLLPTPLPAPPPTLVVCNPPFYDNDQSIGSKYTRQRRDKRQRTDTRVKKQKRVNARSHELITSGGEVEFIRRLLITSVIVGKGVWTCMIGRKKDIVPIRIITSGMDEYVYDVKFERVQYEGKTARWAVAWNVEKRKNGVQGS